MRHLIHTLRQAIPVVDRFLEVTTQTISWRSDPPSWIDVAAFDAAQAAANAPGVTSLLEMDALRTAIDLYRGDLLDGCYDEWVVTVREGFRDRSLAHLLRLSEILVVDGRSAEAIRVCRELLRNDPLREDTSRFLMGVHVVAGDRASAVRVFHECTSTLRRELAVAPAAETVAAYTALMRDAAGEAAEPPSTSILVAPLIGPERELEQLVARWQDAEHGQARLVLVTGEPGVGKTRLVEDLMAWCVPRGVLVPSAQSYPTEELGDA